MAHDLLLGYGAATLETAIETSTGLAIRAELEAFSSALTQSDELRLVLTDPAISGALRRAIAEDLLRGRAAPETQALVDFALRVVHPPELPGAIADLEAATESRLEGVAELPTGGRAARRARIRGYAERILEELSGLPDIDAVEDELFSFARLLDGLPQLREVLADPTAPVAGRTAVLADLLGQKVRPATLRLVSYVLVAGQVRDLVGTYEWLVELAAEERGRRIAQVRAAVQLTAEERAELARVLSRLVHREVEVRVIEDPAVIGGVLVSVGDLLVDGTVRLRFERLREAVAQWA